MTGASPAGTVPGPPSGTVEARFVDVAPVGAPLPALTYRLPGAAAVPEAGARVRIPLGRRTTTGFVLGDASAPGGMEVREVLEVVDAHSWIRPEVRDLALWAADYYLAPPGEVLKLALPPTIRAPGARRRPRNLGYRLADPVPEEERGRIRARARVASALLDRLEEAGGVVPAAELRKLGSSAGSALGRLERAGWIERVEGPGAIDDQILEPAGGPVTRTAEQDRAVEEATGRDEDREIPRPLLLFGVTGSGKTEVYLAAVERVLSRGGQALVLVPEIALTPLALGRFRARFGASVAVLHSGLPGAERSDEWRRAWAGDASVVVGTRLAVFAPLERLALIVVDEEHDASYKQEGGVRYHARDLAVVRARLARCPVVLGSATPSAETFANVRRDRYRIARLPSRVAASLPHVQVVDLRDSAERSSGYDGISSTLARALRSTVATGGQALVFLNRRGWASMLVCGGCGAKPECPDCSVALTLHRRPSGLVCHYCGRGRPVPARCGACGAEAYERLGAGTQRVEDELAHLLPDARVERMDLDATEQPARRAEVLRRVAAGEVDVLVGTQMVAKGHDFPGVTLASVLSIDGLLARSDFRALERAFQLLTQVAGRSGRSERQGIVVIQTYEPENAVFERVRNHDGEGFLERELEFRRQSRYPPHARLIAIGVEGRREDVVRDDAQTLADQLARRASGDGLGVDVLGPAPAAVERVQGRHRRRILVRAPRSRVAHELVREVLGSPPRPRGPAGSHVYVDVDPMTLL